MRPIVIATRKSPLALWQADHVAQALRARTGREVELLPLVTEGDRILDAPLARIGGKGLFVKEIEQALLDGRADLAVHSLKDVPTALPQGLTLGAILEREDPRDALCAPRHLRLDALPRGTRVGTSSLRRRAQLLALRPDLEVVEIRGNVGTRLSKVEDEVDAVILARAGLVRLGLAERITEDLPVERMLPAVGQGALAVEMRADDAEIAALVAGLEHPETRDAVRAERALLARLEGGCQIPLAAHATVEGDRLRLEARLGRPDGSSLLAARAEGVRDEAEAIGVRVAEDLLARGAAEILAELVGRSVGVPH
ncbi:MAG TPA: hydroxymethylbilane synthase [Fredinandcohnia sp.]|nr:hydroxymethylbilane synthase [Fredinandcohnia sp.]